MPCDDCAVTDSGVSPLNVRSGSDQMATSCTWQIIQITWQIIQITRLSGLHAVQARQVHTARAWCNVGAAASSYPLHLLRCCGEQGPTLLSASVQAL